MAHNMSSSDSERDRQDDVLSLDHSDKSFSGFSSVDSSPERPAKKSGKKKKKTSKTHAGTKCHKEKKSSSKSKKGKKAKKTSGSNKENVSPAGNLSQSVTESNSTAFGVDLSKLTDDDIGHLRNVLGMNDSYNQNNGQFAEETDFETVFGDSLNNLAPSMRVEIDRDDVSVTGDLGNRMSEVLFEEGEIKDDEDWSLPPLKIQEKGKPISKSLANMVNMACTSQCDTDNLIKKYKVPENCDKVTPPLVNEEIWKTIDKRAQSQDRSLVETQNMAAAGISSMIKLAEMVKPYISTNSEAKSVLSDAMTLIGQVQYSLSVRRRYMIRPTLKRKYYGLCNINKPITNKLFGDELAKDIKACESMSFVGKEPFYKPSFPRGGTGRYMRGQTRPYNNYGRYNSNYNRYQPYPQQYPQAQRGQSNRGTYQRGFGGFRIPKRTATATATAPNDQK